MQKTMMLFILSFVTLFPACTYVKSEFREKIIQEASQEGEKKNLPEASMARMPLQTGQWVKLFIEENNGSKNVIYRTITVKDISPDHQVVQLEVENQSAFAKAKKVTEKYTIRHFPIESPYLFAPRELQATIYRVQFENVLTKEENQAEEEFPKQFLSFSRSWLQKLFITGSPIDDKEKPQPFACDNGWLNSPRCYSYKYKLDFLDIHTQGQVWSHSEIPILHFLQAKDEFYTYKIIAYGNQK